MDNDALPDRFSKPDVIRELLSYADVVSVSLKLQVAGVVLPPHLKEGIVVLELGYNMRVSIPDLVVDDKGIAATLSFARQPFHCTVPWAAVFAAGIPPHVILLWGGPPPETQPVAMNSPLRVVK